MAQHLRILDTVRLSPPVSALPAAPLPLSGLDTDRNVLDVAFRTLRFFPPLDPLAVLPRAFEAALALFPALAGSLRPDDGHVVVSDASAVPLVLAKSDLSVKDVDADSPGSPLLDLFAPGDGDGSGPVLALQATRFACGGVALGMRVTHALCDGADREGAGSAGGVAGVGAAGPAWAAAAAAGGDHAVRPRPRAGRRRRAERAVRLGEGRVWTAAAAAHEGVLPRERRASGSAQSAARRRGRRQVHVIRGRLRVHLARQGEGQRNQLRRGDEDGVLHEHQQARRPAAPGRLLGQRVRPGVRRADCRRARRAAAGGGERSHQEEQAGRGRRVRALLRRLPGASPRRRGHGGGRERVHRLAAARPRAHGEVDFGWGGPNVVLPLSWRILGSTEPRFLLPYGANDERRRHGFKVFVAVQGKALPGFREEMAELLWQQHQSSAGKL